MNFSRIIRSGEDFFYSFSSTRSQQEGGMEELLAENVFNFDARRFENIKGGSKARRKEC